MNSSGSSRNGHVTGRIDAEYILPLKWHDDSGEASLTGYLMQLSRIVDITVVDGSSAGRFEHHERSWSEYARVIRPGAADSAASNGKVIGVIEGFRVSRHHNVVIADDDVRYTDGALRGVVDALAYADLVRPQNYFHPLPWHARWDTARTLINRAFGSDYPGTLAVRLSPELAARGYSADALFENLELIRTVRALGGREARLDDVFVPRLPPTARHFAQQRVRQAYDDFAQPARLIIELSLLPLAVASRHRPGRLLALALGAIAIAEIGRRRHAGSTAFGPASVLWAPLWVGERAVTVWLALMARFRGGIGYGDARLRLAAHSTRYLRTHRGDHS
jgi:hypothetical protein